MQQRTVCWEDVVRFGGSDQAVDDIFDKYDSTAHEHRHNPLIALLG